MCELHTHSIHVYQYDPTRTTSLRNAFAAEARRRFRELEQAIWKAIVEEDCFVLTRATVYQLSTPGKQAFNFPLDSDKVNGFMRWVRNQTQAGIVEVGELQQVGTSLNSAWQNKYLFNSYKRGVIRARYEMKRAGLNVPSLDETGGINSAMINPFHLDRLGAIYTRAYMGLVDITTNMEKIISHVLTDGLADGDNPRTIARMLVASINGQGMGDLAITDKVGRFIPARRRAEMLARTEVIRAHHYATIQEYKNWAVEGVVVQAEFMTAGDDRVCPDCESKQGNIYTLDEVQNLIPVHPQCRCVAIPVKL